MLDFLWGFLLRSAAMIPAILLTSAAMWLVLRKLGVMRLQEPFDAGDMRTWPLSYAAAEGFLFAVVFAAIAAALGDSKFSVSVGAGVAALVALGVAPVLLVKFRK
jgi:hypothetical protein